MSQTILITGATSGIGKATAMELAKQGHHIILMGRNQTKGQTVLRAIQKVASNRAEFLQADLADFESIRRAADTFNNNFSHLDVLINNAGLFVHEYSTTIDGFETQIGVNHLGHFLLTHLLIEKLKNATQGRIINVSSALHKNGKIDYDTFRGEPKKYKSVSAYAQSKLANVLFTKELSRRLVGGTVTVNTLHPGVVKTNIAVEGIPSILKPLHKLSQLFMVTPSEGAATSIYLATSPKISHITGKYFIKKKEKRVAPIANDESLAKELWDKSCEMVGVEWK